MDKTFPAPGAGPMGLALFLVSLSVLFAASLVGYWVVRTMNPEWATGMPSMPASLWLSTVLLFVSSFVVHGALKKAKAGAKPAVLGKALAVTCGIGLLFLLCQLWVWWSLVQVEVLADRNLYGFTFFMLTALHAIHVIGGLIPLGITTRRAYAGRYTAKDHDGVTMCAMYWHFLDIVWFVIFLNLVFI